MAPSDLGFQIGMYVRENVQGCLDNLSLFEDQFDITILDEIDSEVKVYDKKVVIETRYPVKFKDKQNFEEYTVSKYHTEIDTPLGEAFRIAQRIISEENRLAFLENNTLEMIHASDLPSIGGDIDCTPKVWTIENDIKPFLKAMLIANNKYYTFKKTSKDKTHGQYENYYNAWYNIDLGLSRSTDAVVDVVYSSNWDIDLDIYPSRAGIVEPATKNMPLGFCLNLYNHQYTFQYPVVFKITIPHKSQAYVFMFSTLVSVKDHVPARNVRYSSSVNLDHISINEICVDGEKSVRMIAQDYSNGFYLDNVSLSYHCGHIGCDVGITDLPRSPDGRFILGYDAFLEVELPKCYGGTIVAKKDGYLDSYYHELSVGTYEIDGEKLDLPLENPVVVYMTEMKSLNLNVNVAEFGSSQLGQILGAGEANIRSLKETESYVMELNAREFDYQASLYYTKDNGFFYVVGDSYYTDFSFPVRDATYDLDFKVFDAGNWVGGLTGIFEVNEDQVRNANSFDMLLVRNYDYQFNKYEAVRDVYDLIESHNTTYRPIFS